jgi:hypothetical protein
VELDAGGGRQLLRREGELLAGGELRELGSDSIYIVSLRARS